MNRNEAKKLAETVTSDELKQMFLNAQDSIKDWNVVSRVNKGLSKGAAFNILSSCTINAKDKLISTNMIWEFGEYLPNYKKPLAKEERYGGHFTHQEPKFITQLSQ